MAETYEGSVSAIVTGGAQGIGAAVTQRLAQAGLKVVVVDLAKPNVSVAGAHYAQGSAGDEDVLDLAIAEAQRDSDRLGVFVACAGLSRPGPSATYALADWDALLDINLGAVFKGARQAAANMSAGGSIIAIASVHAHLGFGGRAAYSASKAGVIGLARSLAVEWAPQGIRVNTVSPGYIATDLVTRNIESGALNKEQLLARIPAFRLGSPAEVAEAVWFLASPQSAYVTGTDLLIDGGMAAFGLNLNANPAGTG